MVQQVLWYDRIKHSIATYCKKYHTWEAKAQRCVENCVYSGVRTLSEQHEYQRYECRSRSTSTPEYRQFLTAPERQVFPHVRVLMYYYARNTLIKKSSILQLRQRLLLAVAGNLSFFIFVILF